MIRAVRYVLDVIGNKKFVLSAQPTLTMENTQVVQTGGHFDEAIRTVRMRIAENVFHAPGPLDPGNGMLDPHADT